MPFDSSIDTKLGYIKPFYMLNKMYDSINYINLFNVDVPYINVLNCRWFSLGDLCTMLGFDTKHRRARGKKIIKKRYYNHMARVGDFDLDESVNPWSSNETLLLSEITIRLILSDKHIYVPIDRLSYTSKCLEQLTSDADSDLSQYRPLHVVLSKMFQNSSIMNDTGGTFKIKFKLGGGNMWSVKFKGKMTILIANILNSYSLNQTIEEFSVRSQSGNVYYY